VGRGDVWEGVTHLETDLVPLFRTDMLQRELGPLVEVMVEVVVDVVVVAEDVEGVVGVVEGVVVERDIPLSV
jgi:hypothetical protein